MASNRISAANKDLIRDVYKDKISKLSDKYEKIGKEIAEEKVKELRASKEYKEFKEAYEKFMTYIKSFDPETDFLDSYIDSAWKRVQDDSAIRTPYYYRSNVFKDVNEEMKAIEEEKTNLRKECNKLIWNIEMSPKSSAEYKEALAKAEGILFSKEV